MMTDEFIQVTIVCSEMSKSEAKEGEKGLRNNENIKRTISRLFYESLISYEFGLYMFFFFFRKTPSVGRKKIIRKRIMNHEFIPIRQNIKIVKNFLEMVWKSVEMQPNLEVCSTYGSALGRIPTSAEDILGPTIAVSVFVNLSVRERGRTTLNSVRYALNLY